MGEIEIEIRPLQVTDLWQLPGVITGYTTTETYQISKVETEAETAVSLQLVPLKTPNIVTYDHLNKAELARLNDIVATGPSFGAFAKAALVGCVIASLEAWNNSLRVWEFHVVERLRRQGVGRRMMDGLMQTAVAQNARIIVCETQSTNVPAIRAYRKLGFELDAIDLSFYSNEDVSREDIAVFMKRKL